MDEKSYKSPLSRTQELIEYSDGRKAVRCYGPHNPHYFMDELGALQPIQIAQLEEAVSEVGDIYLRNKNIVSVGFRKDASLYKYIGLRPDFNQASGEEQLEFSIEEIKLDGQAQDIDLSKNQVVSPIAVDLGSVIVRSTRQGTRQMVKVSGPVKDFRIAFKIHLKGLKIEHRADLDEYWIFNDRGDFRFRIVQPQIIDANTLRPLEDEDGDPVYDLVKHSLIDNGDGTFTYIKEPDKGFALADPPRDFLIDADIVYSETSDGWLYRGDLTWEAAHDSETSETIGTADTCKGDAMTAFKIVDQYRIKRSYFYFDVSGLSGTVSSGSVNLYGYQYKQGNVCCQKGTQADTLVKEDYDSFAGAFYSVADWLLDQYNSMTLSAQGKTDLQSVIGSGTFKVCCREYDYDYLNVPRESSTPRNGAYYADEEGTTKDPYLEVTLSGATTLIVDDGSHDHSAESPSLTQLHNLAVQEAEHGHNADNVNLTRIVILAVSGGSHTHVVDGVTLSQIHHLLVANTYHVHLSDKIVFPGEKITETSIESLSMSREVEGLTGSMSLEALSAPRTIESK